MATITSVADWDNEYARLARVASQMRTTTAGGGSGSATVAPPTDGRALRAGLQRLDAALSTLQPPLQASEQQRRRRLVQHLQQTTLGVVDLVGGGGTSTGGAPQQQQRQSVMAQAMRQQDDLIDELAVGVGRLKTQTVAISDEATMHVNLIDDMDTNLDVAYQGLADETRRAATLRQDQSLWKLQLTVAGLLVLLVLEIFLGLTP